MHGTLVSQAFLLFYTAAASVMADYTYTGHSLEPGETTMIRQNSRAVFVDHQLFLPKGALGGFRLRIFSRFPEDVEISPFRLQIWEVTAWHPLPEGKLVMERRIKVGREALGKVIEVPICGDDKLNLTRHHRLGISNEETHNVISVFRIRKRTDRYACFVKHIGIDSDLPKVGASIKFSPFPTIIKFQAGVLIDKTYSAPERDSCSSNSRSYTVVQATPIGPSERPSTELLPKRSSDQAITPGSPTVTTTLGTACCKGPKCSTGVWTLFFLFLISWSGYKY